MSTRLERGVRAALSRGTVRNAVTVDTLTHAGVTAFSGGPATADNARKLSTVDRCIEVLSDSLSKLPIYLVDRETRERVDHPLNYLLGQRPNPYQTASVVKKMVESNRICHGNGYGWIIRSPTTMAPVEIIPLPKENVVPMRARTGEVYYYVTSPYTGEAKFVDHMDMIHVMGYTRNGFSGIGVLERASEVIAASRTRQEYDMAYYANGGQPCGVLECDGDLTGTVEVPDQNGDLKTIKLTDFVRNEWEQNHGGPGNANRIGVLDHGVKYKSVTINHRDAQFIESNELSVKDIARFFGVPLYKLQDGAQSYNANAQNSVEYVVGTLQPIVTQYEEELTYKLLTTEEARKYRVRINMMAELRGDFASRGTWFKNMSDIGAFSVNDILALEDMPNVPGGNARKASLNYVPLEYWEELSLKRNEVRKE